MIRGDKMDTLGIWIFMVIMALPIPLIMIGVGKYMLGSGSEEINDWLGYRTSFSKKNKDTWAFAQKYYGRLLYKPGMFILVGSILTMIPVFGMSSDTIAVAGCVVELYLLAGIIPTERALHKTFDKTGKRLD